MKFRKVKIQAFRAYNKVEDGTFDFSLSDEQNADFVSLYAPNGFGKTSFFDAVEYGFTDSIDRFLKNIKLNKEAAKSERQLNTQHRGQYILRNRNSPDDLITEIKIYLTNCEKPITKEIPTSKRKGSVDFPFDGIIKNKYFQSVILSQDWIDAFLKVEDPFVRYEKFMDFFGDKKIDEYYKKLIELINLNDKRIEELKNRLKGVQKELDFNGDKDILTKINDKIIELKASGEFLSIIEESFTESDSLNWANVISERISDSEYEKTKQEELIKSVNSIFSGSEDVKGLETYFELRGTFAELVEKGKEYVELLEKYKLTKRYINELNVVSDSRKQLIQEKEDLEDIQKAFPIYLKENIQIKNIENEINNVKEKRSSLDEAISNFRIIESDVKSKISNLNEGIALIDNHLKELPELLDRFNTDTSKLNELQGKLVEENLKLKPIEQSKTELELQIFNINTALQEINKGQYPSIFNKEFLTFRDIIIEIEKNEKDLKEERNKFNEVGKTIKEQEILNKDIEQFISKGAEIIDKTQSSTCPLCNNEYSSFRELSERITNNKLLSGLLSVLLKERSTIEIHINELIEQLNRNKKVLIDSLNKEMHQKQESLAKLMIDLLKINEDRQELLIEYKDTSNSLQSYNSLLRGISYEEYEKNNKESLDKLKAALKLVVAEFEKNHRDLEQKISELNFLENKIEVFDKAIQRLQEDKDFFKVDEYFKLSFPNQKVELETIVQRIEYFNNLVNENTKRIDDIQKIISNLEMFLKNSTQELTEEQLKLTEKVKESLKQVMISFELQVNSILQIEIESCDKETLSTQLNQIRNNAKLIIEKQEKKIKDYNLLSELKKNVGPYLKYEQAKKTKTEIKERTVFLEKKVKIALEEEKKEVSMYLDKKIKSFFYEDLINDLYRRIDPHPDYKKIRFICDFKEDKPKLNVCLYKDEKFDDPIFPNLYFSTAQLNILSLSIFLAKALNAKDDEGNPIDCIFIDDPIQSMDNINILSTIDLLRSLVKNEGKQIILSTHDENFHNLLKKKIPSNLFKSKFMELETFGKVKKE